MAFSNNNFITLFEDIKKISSLFGGHGKRNSLSESTLIAYMISRYNLINYFEYGSKLGENFFSASYAVTKVNGIAYASCLPPNREDFLHQKNVLIQIIEKEGFSNNSTFIETEADWESLFQYKIGIDLLNIKNREINKYEQIEKLIRLVNESGFIICDTFSFNIAKAILKQDKKQYVVLLESEELLIVRVGDSIENASLLEKRKLENLFSMIQNLENSQNTIIDGTSNKKPNPLVSVIVISYNQERYIAECLHSIFAQRGDFQLELVISDDLSKDETFNIIQDYAHNFGEHVNVKIISSDANVGMTRNFQRCLNACTGDFIAVCEGDDYWIDIYKIQKQLNFFYAHPECSICFNNIYIYFEDTKEYITFDLQHQLIGEITETRDLVSEYYIGNLSCCMYEAKHMKEMSEELFDLYIGDWMFNIYYSRFGKIGQIKECMSVYRKHTGGVWSGRSPVNRDVDLYSKIEEYNNFLKYEFDLEFSAFQKKIEITYPAEFIKASLDIGIIDEVFPHPLSSFKYAEFLAYLKNFPDTMIYSTGRAISLLGNKKLGELIFEFKQKFPEFKDNVKAFNPYVISKAKIYYFVFLGSAYSNLDYIEDMAVPFVFTLYPGGHFGINNAISDRMLKRVTSSPCFKKVIVTQKITYDYLIRKKYCTPEQIEFIFGVVTPLEQIEKEYIGKKHFGVDKDILDICFVAHKYTETGIDKGYDVFVAVANVLSQKYQNVRFHVVGGFDENVLDVSDLQGRIKFYGNQEMEWFDEFYRDKDIILSPNIPFKIFEGSFDGFPTGSCTDAGLRETAIFCTDELKLNDGFFIDGEEIVIIPHDIKTIIEIIEFYYREPEKLKNIAKNGRKKIKELYGYESQILPRINLLKEQIQLFEHNKEEIRKKFNSIRYFPNLIRRFTMLISRVLRKLISLIPVPLKNRLKSILPSFFIKIYNRFFI